MLAADRAALGRFVGWVSDAGRSPESLSPESLSLEILFTPYGEALVWPWYRDALVCLSRLPQVRRVTIQTNGAAPMAFLDKAEQEGGANREKVALWISWHPSEVPLAVFAEKIGRLHAVGVPLSVGAVAVPENVHAIEAMRAALPAAVPMWINAQKPGVRYLPEDLARWIQLDPAFPLDVRPHRSRGKACDTGEETISVDGDGTIRRCHFVEKILGNLYTDELSTLLHPRPCPRLRCDCYIGYAHLLELGLRRQYGEGLLARLRGG